MENVKMEKKRKNIEIAISTIVGFEPYRKCRYDRRFIEMYMYVYTLKLCAYQAVFPRLHMYHHT
jgi:hypothetical protein